MLCAFIFCFDNIHQQLILQYIYLGTMTLLIKGFSSFIIYGSLNVYMLNKVLKDKLSSFSCKYVLERPLKIRGKKDTPFLSVLYKNGYPHEPTQKGGIQNRNEWEEEGEREHV